MVVPNTYELSKWKTDDVTAQKDAKARLVAQAKLENNDNEKYSQTDLTQTQKLDVKYGLFQETLEDLKARETDFNRFLRMIIREKNKESVEAG